MEAATIGLGLMSIAITQYGVVPLLADLNATHALNPRWTGHARFHVVTQSLTSAAIAIVALTLLWSTRLDRSLGICLAATLSYCVLGAFFLSALTRKFYGGTLHDAAGGIPPAKGIDLNTLNFGIAALLLSLGRGLLFLSS